MSSAPRRADAYAVLGAVLVGVYFAFGVIAGVSDEGADRCFCFFGGGSSHVQLRG